jgi:hypothetical protein
MSSAHEWYDQGGTLPPGLSLLGPRRTPAEWDAVTLERAAEILRARTKNPRGLWLNAFCKALVNIAAKIRAEDSGHAAD